MNQGQCCQYSNRHGDRCTEPVYLNGLCYWHSPVANKQTPELKEKLVEYAQTGRPMCGFRLANADLSNIDLVNHGSRTGYDLSDADLYHADLSGAHLYKVNLQGASLMRANLGHATLNEANLELANLLGIHLQGAKTTKVHWGEQLLQEQQVSSAGSRKAKQLLLHESEEIYRNLRKNCESQGLFRQAGEFFRKEMVMRRRQMPRNSWRRLRSWAVDAFSGYGERPLRVVAFSLMLITVCALLYYALGIKEDNQIIQFSADRSLGQILTDLRDCFYFSVVTFTTLGYGDLAPMGVTRIIAALEAFSGSFTMALFVVVLVKKMTR